MAQNYNRVQTTFPMSASSSAQCRHVLCSRPQASYKHGRLTGQCAGFRHHSVRGVQLWTASRMVELTFKRFAMLCSGTWAMNYYLRALGAKIGNWSTFRLGLCLPLLPDSMDLGSG